MFLSKAQRCLNEYLYIVRALFSIFSVAGDKSALISVTE
ncbi:hypothetical protein X560_0908 [Listeria fleischmannii 1991]|uniref:Uncharacterized protein n=1 Tax=Listeria fleischmannii 1991 TaxID=1430899 RepID=A0A0J8GB83_9LIST|nr:hypothetical protein X560_0908 [Listeria fleischmannii 1991]